MSCKQESQKEIELKEIELKEILIKGIQSTNDLNFEKAYEELHSALTMAKKYNSKKYEILAYINIGLLYDTYNEKEKALFYALKSLDLANEYKIDEVYNAIYNNLGIIYSDNNNFEEAEIYFRKALSISKIQEKPNRIGINLINIARIKDEEGFTDSALFYNNSALLILTSNDIFSYHSFIYNNIAEIQYNKGEIEKAMENYKVAVDYEKINNDQSNIGQFELGLGKAMVQLLQYDSAYYYLNTALKSLIIINDSELISDCYFWLYKNENTNLSNPIALNYFEECIAWKDSSMFQKMDEWLSNGQMRYEFGKKQKEIEYLEEKASLQKRIIYTIITISILFILLLISIWKSRNRNLKQRNLFLKKEKELTKLELEHKSKEITSRAVHLMNKNEILGKIFQLLEEAEKSDKDIFELLRDIKILVKNNLNQDKAWDDFRLHFEQLHESFMSQLKQKHPGLSPTDFRLCAYLLIDLSPKEIANISNISPESVRKRKQRLRQKLSLEEDIEIEVYLKSL